MIRRWDDLPSAEMVVTLVDGKAHAFIGVCQHEAGTCHYLDDCDQCVEIDARKGPVTIAFVRHATRTQATEAALAKDGPEDYVFVLGKGDRIHVRPIVDVPDPAALARAAKIDAVLSDPRTRAELVDRLQLEAVDAQIAALKVG